MKLHFKTILAVIFIPGILSNCKKDTSPAVKDYAASISDKTWWGEFNYTGKPIEYYSVYFKPDKTLVWSQFDGDYSGNWNVSGANLTMSFDASAVEIRATVTEDNKLSSLSDNTDTYEIKSGEWITNPNILLDNTEWEGSLIFMAGVYHYYLLTFLPGSYVLVLDGYNTFTDKNYTRSRSAIIRAHFKPPSSGGSDISEFGIIISDSVMIGSQGRPDIKWLAIKK